MSFLIDTNVISELRKGDRANRGVTTWFGEIEDEEIFLSVLTVGELRRGIESISRRDSKAGSHLNQWLARLVMGFEGRIVPVDGTIAEEWGRMNVPDPLPVVDGLLAATAKIRGLTVATRNLKDVASTGIETVNPFE
ncbi:MAG: type II toxin-antitoxin system VapC family toxin [Solirubrobacterales bacterium]